MKKRNTEKGLNEIHIKLKKYRLDIRKFQIRKNDKSVIRTLVNLIRLHSLFSQQPDCHG